MKKLLSHFNVILFSLVAVIAAFAGFSAFADTAPVVSPPIDWVGLLTNLYSAFANHAGTAVVIVAIVQVLKTAPVIGFLSNVEGKYVQLTVALVTTLGYIASAVVTGSSWTQAALTGLLTAGGAMLIYDGYAAINAPAVPVAPVAPPAAQPSGPAST